MPPITPGSAVTGITSMSFTALDPRARGAAGTMPGKGEGRRLQRRRFLLHGEIAFGVAGGGADDADVDWKGLVQQTFLAGESGEFDEVLGAAGVELAAAVAR